MVTPSSAPIATPPAVVATLPRCVRTCGAPCGRASPREGATSPNMGLDAATTLRWHSARGDHRERGRAAREGGGGVELGAQERVRPLQVGHRLWAQAVETGGQRGRGGAAQGLGRAEQYLTVAQLERRAAGRREGGDAGVRRPRGLRRR